MSRIKFNIEELDYQTQAVNSVSDLFGKAEKTVLNPIYKSKLNEMKRMYIGTGDKVANGKISSGRDLLEELRAIQYINGLPLNDFIDDEGGTLNLTIDMETGARVIIVTGAMNILKSSVSGTLEKYNSCIA